MIRRAKPYRPNKPHLCRLMPDRLGIFTVPVIPGVTFQDVLDAFSWDVFSLAVAECEATGKPQTLPVEMDGRNYEIRLTKHRTGSVNCFVTELD